MSWFQSVERLNRTAASELNDALRQRDDLVAAARALAPYTAARTGMGAPTSSAGCPVPRCAFHDRGDGAAMCALVADLDRVGAAIEVSVRPLEDVTRLVDGFLAALAESLDAVRYCRLTEHPAGRCWFAADSGGARCGEILRLAHRLRA